MIKEVTGEHVGTCGAGIYETYLRSSQTDVFPELRTNFHTILANGVRPVLDLMDTNHAKYIEKFRIPKFNDDYKGDYTELFRKKYLYYYDAVMQEYYDKYSDALTTVYLMASPTVDFENSFQISPNKFLTRS